MKNPKRPRDPKSIIDNEESPQASRLVLEPDGASGAWRR